MNGLNDLYAPRIVKLREGTFGGVYTTVSLTRVADAVQVKDKKLVFAFNNPDQDEYNFYILFFSNVAAFTENLARSQASYLLSQLNANPTAYTLVELAFLAKTLYLPYWTLPISMSFEAWEQIARTNPSNLPIVFEQLLATNPSPDTPQTQPGPGTGSGNTGTGGGGTGNTGTGNTGTTITSTATNNLILSVIGGVLAYFITKFLTKKAK